MRSDFFRQVQHIDQAPRPNAAFLFLTLSLCLLFHISSAFAQRNTYIVSGQVSLPNNSPANAVLVKLVSDGQGINMEMVTGDRGQFEFRNLYAGTYRVSARNPAEPTQFTDTVEVNTANTFTGNMVVNLTLRVPDTAGVEHKKGLLTVAEATQKIPKKARKLYEQGMKYQEEGKSAEALGSFNEAIEIYPAYFQAVAARGEVHLASRKYAEAIKEFTRAIELNESYEPALREAGYCLLEQRDYKTATDYLGRAVKLDPLNASSHLMLGISYLEQKQDEAAESALKQALRINPLGAVRAHIHLANLYSAQHRYREAVDELQIYLNALPTAPDAAQIKAAQDAMRARIK